MTGRQHDRTWRRTVRRLRWRARHGTAVVRWSAGLALAATGAHALAATWWPVPVLAAGCGVAALTIGRWAVLAAARRGWVDPDPDARRVLRRRQRAHEGAVALALAGGLTGAVWAAGWAPWSLTAWLVATGAVGGGWAFRQRVRRREATARRREREAAEDEARKAAKRALSRAQRAYREQVVTAARIEREGLGIAALLALAHEYELTDAQGREVLADAVESGDLERRRDGWAGSRWCSPWHDRPGTGERGGRAARLRVVGDD